MAEASMWRCLPRVTFQRPSWTNWFRKFQMVHRKSGTSVRRSMMTEIFLNALEVAYAIFHAAVVYGWSLLIFYVYNDQDDFVGCPVNPAIPIFIHTLSGTSICGLLLWISGHVFDCSYKMPIKRARIDAEAILETDEEAHSVSVSSLNEEPEPVIETATQEPDIQIIVEVQLQEGDENSENGPAKDEDVIQVAADETDNDKVLLIVNEPGMKFKFTFYHLAYFLVCVAHVTLIILGTFLTVPMFFTNRLYEIGMTPGVCNETLYWFALLMVGCEYLLIATFGLWFLCDVIIAARLEEAGLGDNQDIQDE